MRLKNLDLTVTVIIAVLNVASALFLSPNPPLGIILALPLVFVLPGYTLTEALFHKRSLDASHRLLLSLGLSLAIDILSGLILNLFPVGLQVISWAALLGLLTGVFSLLVAYLRKRAPVNRRHPPRFNLTIHGAILFGLAIAFAVVSFLYAFIGVEKQPHPGFTQFWMLPSAQTGKSCTVRLGINSFESTSVTYRITITVNGAQVTSRSSITLAPQQEWDRLVSITSVVTGSVFVDARLYRLDKPETIYREVHVTLPSCASSQINSKY